MKQAQGRYVPAADEEKKVSYREQEKEKKSNNKQPNRYLEYH